MKNNIRLNPVYTNEEIIKFYNEKNNIMTSRNLHFISDTEFLWFYLEPAIKADLLQNNKDEKGKRNLIIRVNKNKTMIVNRDNLNNITVYARRQTYVAPFLTFGKAKTEYSLYDQKKILCLDVDIDGFPDSILFNYVMQLMFDEKKIPIATFIINSGTGIHLIYLFKEPKENTEETQLLKEALCKKIDDILFHKDGQTPYHLKLKRYISRLNDENQNPHVDYRSTVQLFRMPSALTKIGEELAETKEERINNIATCVYTGVLNE